MINSATNTAASSRSTPYPVGRSQIDQHQRRQGDQADAQYRGVRLRSTPDGPPVRKRGHARRVPWQPPPFDDEVSVEGDDVGHSALVDQGRRPNTRS
jgi:hypothetical protein